MIVLCRTEFVVFTPLEKPRLPRKDEPPVNRESVEGIEFDRTPELAASEPLNEL